MIRRLLVVVVAGLAVLGTGCASGASGAAGASSGSASSGVPGALTTAFTLIDGTSTSFSAYRGKPVVVNFFSSTCVPCVAEMPALESVNQELGGAVHFVGLNPQDTVAGARSFAAAENVSWDIALDPDASLAAELGVINLPTTVVLDPDGRIVATHQGALTADELRSTLREHGLIA